MSKILEQFSLPRLVVVQTIITALLVGGGGAAIIFSGGSTVDTAIALAVTVALSFGMALIVGRHIAARATRFAKALNALANGDLSHRCAIPGKDEFSWFSYEYSCARKSVSKMVESIHGDVKTLMADAGRLRSVSEETKRGLTKQNAETLAVASSMDLMADTVQQ